MAVRGVRLPSAAAAFLIVHSTEGAQYGLVADTAIHGLLVCARILSATSLPQEGFDGPARRLRVRYHEEVAVVIDVQPTTLD